MPFFYRVFRHPPGEDLSLTLALPEGTEPIYLPANWHTREDAAAVLAQRYPEGLSNHGRQYLFNRFYSINDQWGENYTSHIPLVELVFELTRLAQFPERRSRFAAFFGCETLEDAQRFRAERCNGQGIICLVSCEQYFRADMNSLSLGAGIPSAFVLSERYWRGEAGPNPFWEILMQGPVSILEQIDPAPRAK
ncbi:hypothetical protein [Hymenobacter arizonensis]|uniref:DUF2441 domain-containing protein n=1 Tax=Hymenobacter arizonensis TaxID=1227077 RepID=A0A1I5T8U1_HYMAR|nr:hypothetical protein [Hymenobacter arizonensis]SFP78896.1 hypothetical protein SAMN04515668_0346 [Hymenobacter arizonensis]